VFQPTVAGDAVVAGYSKFGRQVSGGLLVVDRATGRERWRREFPPESPNAATGFGGGPVVTGDVVAASSGDGRIFGFDCESGRVRWTLPRVARADGRPQDRDWRALGVGGSLLIAGSVSGVVLAVDIGTLKEKWRFVHPDGGSVALRLIADSETAYVPHMGGLMVAIDVRDGSERWQIGGFSDGFNWAPVLAGGNVYAAASRAGLFALPR
jgi:outer membrane protein assembly factor BamB